MITSYTRNNYKKQNDYKIQNMNRKFSNTDIILSPKTVSFWFYWYVSFVSLLIYQLLFMNSANDKQAEIYLTAAI